jgi:hypothetical protein
MQMLSAVKQPVWEDRTGPATLHAYRCPNGTSAGRAWAWWHD